MAQANTVSPKVGRHTKRCATSTTCHKRRENNSGAGKHRLRVQPQHQLLVLSSHAHTPPSVDVLDMLAQVLTMRP